MEEGEMCIDTFTRCFSISIIKSIGRWIPKYPCHFIIDVPRPWQYDIEMSDARIFGDQLNPNRYLWKQTGVGLSNIQTYSVDKMGLVSVELDWLYG